jgi:hypothetical protein
MTAPDANTEALIGFGLFFLSEIIALSKLKDNSILQLVLHMGSELFPYELQRKEPATRANRPRKLRDSHGRYVSDEK